MRQLTFVKPRVVEWHDVAAPGLEGPRQAVVAPVAATTCDLDRSLIKGRAPYEGPIALGHEFVARVVDVGEAVQEVVPGDIVAVPAQISCGDCDRCRAGSTAFCRAVMRKPSALPSGSRRSKASVNGSPRATLHEVSSLHRKRVTTGAREFTSRHHPNRLPVSIPARSEMFRLHVPAALSPLNAVSSPSGITAPPTAGENGEQRLCAKRVACWSKVAARSLPPQPR